MTRSTIQEGSALVALASVVTGAMLPLPAFGQSVADRALSDVKVDNVGQCSTLTVNFNIRVQMLSHFPTQAGRELHIRLRPLDDAHATSLRESLRTPVSVPALRSIEYEGDNPSGPVLSLFFTQDMRFEIKPGAQATQLVIKLDQPRPGPVCTVADGAPSLPTQATAKPAIAIPSGLYAINLASVPGAIQELTQAQEQALAGRIVYQTNFERDSQHWRRLRAGFFDTREQAEAARVQLAAQFPDAWIVKVSAEERTQGVASRMDTVRAPVGTTPDQPAVAATEADVADTLALIGDAEAAIRAGDNDRAIQLLTNASGRPANEHTPRAIELLGLTRERKGQMAHAQAEYEEYLRRYPDGEAADRVRQRLAAVKVSGTVAPGPVQTLRSARGSVSAANAWTWGARGSFSQFYFRDQSTTKFVDASRPSTDPDIDNSVNLNQLMSSADVTISGGNDRRQVQLRAAGSYTGNFRNPGRDIKTLTAAYIDYSENGLGMTARIGRQTRNSAGVLGRFDGALIGWQARPKLRFSVVGGFPVQSSRQLNIQNDRPFYGVSAQIGGRTSPLQTTVYWFDQRARGGFTDRRSLGLEARYLKSRFNAYTMVDYDVKFRKLNLGLLTVNYNFPDNSNLSVTADYRQSPLLTTSNALIGQMDPLTLLPITELRGLRPFYTDDQIYQLAKDRTLVAKSATVSYSRPLTKKLQANLDFTVTDTGGTPASGGVSEIPKTGTEYYYGAQLVGSGLLWGNDIYILSGRYSDTQRARSYTADFNARVPITAKLRISPRVRYGIRTDKFVDSKFRQFQPTMRVNYYPIRNSEVEVEFGGNFNRQRSVVAGALNTMSETGWVLSAGYRFDF